MDPGTKSLADHGTGRLPEGSLHFQKRLSSALPPGLGEERHWAESSLLSSPFGGEPLLDHDLRFCARVMVILGLSVPAWRHDQIKALDVIAKWLEKADARRALFKPPLAIGKFAHKAESISDGGKTRERSWASTQRAQSRGSHER